EAGRGGKGDDSAAARFEPYRNRTRHARDRAGPRAGRVDYTSRAQSFRVGHHRAATAVLNHDRARFAPGANYSAAAARVTEIPGEKFVHVDAAACGKHQRALRFLK